MALTLVFFFLFFEGFPNEPAAEIALNTVKSWIEENPDKVGHARHTILDLLSVCGGSVIHFHHFEIIDVPQ